MHKRTLLLSGSGIALIALLALLLSGIISATPTGPSIVQSRNETMTAANPAMLNESTGGGYVYTVNITSNSQNMRWKAYVGNISGKWVLQDSSAMSIYEWVINSSLFGEIYATRKPTTVQWADINCTWVGATGDSSTPNTNPSLRGVEENESIALGFNRLDDNLTTTFNEQIHSQMTVGTRVLAQNSCWAIYTFVAGVPQNKGATSYFEEVLLYDGTNITSGSVVYATFIENNQPGFDNTPYDFQIIVPANGTSQSIMVPYYFYIELD